MTIQQAQALAGKILAGEGSSAEKAALRQYLADHKHLPELAEQLLPLTELEGIPESPLPAGMEEKILQPILQEVPVIAFPPKPAATKRILLRMGAAAAILIGVCLLLFQFIPALRMQQTAVVLQDSISTSGGQIKDITLKDGTRIRLNGNSTLRYPPTFDGVSREVYLDGEAFFEVGKDPARHFIVHSSAFTTTVLGTSFNIRSSGDEQNAEIAVATGKVQVKIPGHKMADSVAYLLPGEKASYQQADSRGFQTSKTAIAAIGSWRERRFYYDQAPLSQILNDLKRSYGLRFRVKDPNVLACTFSVTFRNMKAEAILESLSLMSGIVFNPKDGSVEVSGNACN